MATAIVTDSNCGIAVDEAETLNIHIIPMPILINEISFYEGLDISYSELLQHLMDKDHVTTSQPAPTDLETMWDKLLESKYDDIIYIPMSSGLSSSYQTACMLSKDYNGAVYVVDAHRIFYTIHYSAHSLNIHHLPHHNLLRTSNNIIHLPYPQHLILSF